MPRCEVDAPGQALQLNWSSSCSLKTVLDAFCSVWRESAGIRLPPTLNIFCEQRVASHQAIWNELDDLDAHVWVLEPLPGSRSRGITMRRIGLGTKPVRCRVEWRGGACNTWRGMYYGWDPQGNSARCKSPWTSTTHVECLAPGCSARRRWSARCAHGWTLVDAATGALL